jgi:hypothetical protein
VIRIATVGPEHASELFTVPAGARVLVLAKPAGGGVSVNGDADRGP